MSKPSRPFLAKVALLAIFTFGMVWICMPITQARAIEIAIAYVKRTRPDIDSIPFYTNAYYFPDTCSFGKNSVVNLPSTHFLPDEKNVWIVEMFSAEKTIRVAVQPDGKVLSARSYCP